jgi:hypothetical protein
MSNTSPLKHPFLCEGTITWVAFEVCDDTRELTKAIFRSGTDIALETQVDGTRYTIPLTSIDGFSFSGHFTSKGKDFEDSGTIHVRFYCNNNNYILYGEWIENGDLSHVIIRFTAAREV